MRYVMVCKNDEVRRLLHPIYVLISKTLQKLYVIQIISITLSLAYSYFIER